MVTLTQIRELVLRQDKELEELLYEYIKQNELDANFELDTTTYNKKEKIEELISQDRLYEARQLLNQYKLESNDISIYSMEGIINIKENKLEEALKCFLQGLEMDNRNVDLLYNMGYLNSLVGNNEKAIEYYKECSGLTNDENLLNELNDLINSLNTSKNYTLVTLNFNKDDELFSKLNENDNKIMNVVVNDELESEDIFEHNDIKVYEIKPASYLNIINHVTQNNENCIVLYRDIKDLELVNKIQGNVLFVYYPNKNYYNDREDYINQTMNVFDDKELSNKSNIILTDDLFIFSMKRIIEKRDNVYLLNDNMDYILTNYSMLDESLITNINSEDIEDDFLKRVYELIKNYSDDNKCLEIARSLYRNYENEHTHSLYLGLLIINKEYDFLVDVVSNSEYIDDYYKYEILYLYDIKDYDLIDYVVNIVIKNYRALDLSSENNLDYKLGLYYYVINKFNDSYKTYLYLIEKNEEFLNSPIVNKFVAYMMYAKGEDRYEEFNSRYKEIITKYE